MHDCLTGVVTVARKKVTPDIVWGVNVEEPLDGQEIVKATSSHTGVQHGVAGLRVYGHQGQGSGGGVVEVSKPVGSVLDNAWSLVRDGVMEVLHLIGRGKARWLNAAGPGTAFLVQQKGEGDQGRHGRLETSDQSSDRCSRMVEWHHPGDVGWHDIVWRAGSHSSKLSWRRGEKAGSVVVVVGVELESCGRDMQKMQM